MNPYWTAILPSKSTLTITVSTKHSPAATAGAPAASAQTPFSCPPRAIHLNQLHRVRALKMSMAEAGPVRRVGGRADRGALPTARMRRAPNAVALRFVGRMDG